MALDFSKYFSNYNPVVFVPPKQKTLDIIPTYDIDEEDEEDMPLIVSEFNNPYPVFRRTPEQATVTPEPSREQSQPKRRPKPTEEPVQIRSFQSNSKVINNIIDIGRKEVGKKYLSGTHGPNTYDCSGFVFYMFNKGGIKVPLNIFKLTTFGKEISSLKDAQIGDMIVTPGSGKSGLHVKVISKMENGKIYVLEAAGKKTGVVERELKNTSNIRSIRRFV